VAPTELRSHGFVLVSPEFRITLLIKSLNREFATQAETKELCSSHFAMVSVFRVILWIPQVVRDIVDSDSITYREGPSMV
jgi:hypothetical protein